MEGPVRPKAQHPGTSRRRFLQQAAALGLGAPMVALLGRAEVTNALARHQTGATPVAGSEMLPSWRPGERREAMLSFVAAVTDESGANYVAPAERFATFDLDGTLMVSHPMYAEIVFTYDRVHALAADHPEWQTTEPYRTLLSEPVDQLWKINQQDAQQALADLHAGLTVDEFIAVVREWSATNRHPKFDRPQTELIYRPMLEVIDYLHQHDFACYIVSGSGQEFIRSFSPANIGIPPERVVGTAMVPKFEHGATDPRLVLTSEVLYVDDSDGKPEGINLVIGHRPLAAFGNSDGDVQMLEYTGAGAGARLMMIVHHDDAEREYAYDVDTEVGRLSQATMDLAHEKGWHLISMKDDWATIF
jgi:phosphoglycolate phosphatase-like HAD superfamily hydrolase